MRSLVFRSIHRGRVVYGQAGRVLEQTSTRLVTATVPGDAAVVLEGDRFANLRLIARGEAEPVARPWHTHRVVWITPFERSYSLGLFFLEEGLRSYYVNLQAPARVHGAFLDSFDYQLDVVVGLDGTWRWKDEDEFGLAVELGMYTAEQAAAIRAEGERVIAELPTLLPTGWEAWRPDPAWPPLTLPKGWDEV